MKNLAEALPLTRSGPTGKTEWNNWPEVMQKRIKWACCNSKIFVELPILFQVRRGYFNSFRMMTQITGIMDFMQEIFFVIKGRFFLHWLKMNSCAFLSIASHALSSAAFLCHLFSLKSVANKEHVLSKQTLEK